MTRLGFDRIARTFSHRDYAIYMAGNVVWLIGNWMYRVAVGWLAWELTHSPSWLGLIAFGDLIPSVVAGPIAGAFADRWNRLAISRISMSVAASHGVMLFALVALDAITVEILLGLTVFLGFAIGFNQPARLLLITELVPRESLASAVAINSLTFNVARFIGPAVAGVVILWGGLTAVFAIVALTYPFFLIALFAIRSERANAPVPTRDDGILADLVAGIRYAVTHPGIAPLLLMLSALTVFSRPVIELLPGVVAQIFTGGAGTLAAFTSTVGVGAIIGGVWLAGRSGPQGLTRLALVNGVVVAVAQIAFVATGRIEVGLAALLVAGFAQAVVGIGVQTLLQLAVDPAMHGRALGLYAMVFRVGPALGALLMGIAAEHFGFRWPFLVGAVLLAGAVGWTSLKRRVMVEALEVPAGQEPPARPADRKR